MNNKKKWIFTNNISCNTLEFKCFTCKKCDGNTILVNYSIIILWNSDFRNILCTIWKRFKTSYNGKSIDNLSCRTYIKSNLGLFRKWRSSTMTTVIGVSFILLGAITDILFTSRAKKTEKN